MLLSFLFSFSSPSISLFYSSQLIYKQYQMKILNFFWVTWSCKSCVLAFSLSHLFFVGIWLCLTQDLNYLHTVKSMKTWSNLDFSRVIWVFQFWHLQKLEICRNHLKFLAPFLSLLTDSSIITAIDLQNIYKRPFRLFHVMIVSPSMNISQNFTKFLLWLQ